MSKQSKQAREPKINEFSYEEFVNNTLSLPDTLKQDLMAKGLSWRFINAAQFREKGNIHRTRWTPYKVENATELGISNLTVEGMIRRGDLILATRPKSTSENYKKMIEARNKALSGYNGEAARDMRKMAREYSVGEHTKVYEGYEENE